MNRFVARRCGLFAFLGEHLARDPLFAREIDFCDLPRVHLYGRVLAVNCTVQQIALATGFVARGQLALLRSPRVIITAGQHVRLSFVGLPRAA
jgi:hypothetical protein